MQTLRTPRTPIGLLAATALAAPILALQSTARTVDDTSAAHEIGEEPRTTPGERVPVEAFGPARIVNMLELHELEKTLPHRDDGFIQRARNDAQGIWIVPSLSTSERPHSGDRYIVNKWGDTSMGIGFEGAVDFAGVWVAGQSAPSVWADGVRVVGYRDGEEVARSEWFRDVDDTPSWFATDLRGIDRVVFEAGPVVQGAGWYALDDLTFVRNGATVVLDFEDLDPKTQLTDSRYEGLVWETGTGLFEQDVRSVDQPLLVEEPEPSSTSVGGANPPFGGSGTAPNLIQEFPGPKLGDVGAGFIPPDTCGAVGLDHFVSVVNSNFSVYSKTTGARVVNISLSNLFNVGGGPGDPRIVFDPHSQRWFVIATNFSDRVYLAASSTSDPTGNFFTSSFLTSQGSDSGKSPDYPTLGVDVNGVYTGVAMFGGSTTMTIFAVDKAPLIAGAQSLGTVTAFRGFSFDGAIQPCVTYGNPGREYFISRRSSTTLRLREVLPPLTSPTLNTLGSVPIQNHNFPPDAPALGSNVDLDSVDHRPMNAVYRNGSVWTAHAVGVGGRAAARWYEVDPGSQSVNQFGTVSDGTLSFIMPTIAVNSQDDVVLGFSGSSPNQFAGAYFTGRLSTDPSGQTGIPIEYRAGSNSYQLLDGFGRNRWGDYSLCSVDPQDDLTFWTIQEYARTGVNTWGTRIAELGFGGFPDCNNNGVDDADDISSGTSDDCDGNGVPDECDPDCDTDGTPDDCEVDCNSNGTPDDCEAFADCNLNGIPDECDPDCDSDGNPDDCETDCNANGTPDDCEAFADCNSNGVPDECDPDCDSDGTPDDCEPDCDSDGTPDDCEPDCDSDGLPDDCEVDCNSNGTPDDCEAFADCNSNGIPDECDPDCDSDGTPDDCEADCDSDGTPDDCEPDCDSDGTPDDCEPDCDSDGLPDDCEVDCNSNGTPDDCEAFDDCDSNGIPDDCDPDCDSDGTPDDCEPDCDNDGTPDDCEADCDSDGTPDDCETDCNSNGTPDDCEVFDDCNTNGVPDECDISSGSSDDDDSDGIPDECEVLGTNYCAGAPNSAGPGSSMSAVGSDVVADNDFTLETEGNPASVFGIFYYGPTQINVPFGDGVRCVGGTTQRVQPSLQTSASGDAARTIDLTALPHVNTLMSGSEWNFQFWYRDPMGPGGTGFNTSDAVNIVFQ